MVVKVDRASVAFFNSRRKWDSSSSFLLQQLLFKTEFPTVVVDVQHEQHSVVVVVELKLEDPVVDSSKLFSAVDGI